MKTILFIGSTSYKNQMVAEGAMLTAKGYKVLYPVFDNHQELDELGVVTYNRDLMERADEVYIMWDGRSMGTVFDLGMAWAMRKPVRVIHINNRSFKNLMMQMSGEF